MPAIETMDLHQRAVLYAAATATHPFDAFGNRQVIAPVEVACRWVKRRRELTDPNRGTIVTEATVILAQQAKEGSILWLGSFSDLQDSGRGTGTGADDGPTGDIHEVVSSTVTPDLKNRHTRWEHQVRRYTDSLPEIVAG